MGKGIDVSVWQGVIDWKKVKDSGIEFAMIREGFGRREPKQIDKYFHKNIKAAQDNGIYCGAYHYSYSVSVDDAKEEADFCLSNINDYKLEFPVAFDVEDKSMIKLGKRTLTDICKSFCDYIESAGYYAIIYTNPNWLRNHLYSDELLPKYDIWLADWNKDKPSYQCGIWQFSDKGSVYGINGDVDMNLSYKNYAEIIKSRGLNGFKPDTNISSNNNNNSQNQCGSDSYTVNVGDTLWVISEKILGDGKRYKEIKELNKLLNDIIYPGQILKIPKVGNQTFYKTHVVKKGDTLWNLSERYYGDGSKYKEIKKLNGLGQDNIYVGQVLKI